MVTSWSRTLTALTLVSACGGSPAPAPVGVTPRAPVFVESWPRVAAEAEAALTVRQARSAAVGTEVRVRGSLQALSPPCPRCVVHGSVAARAEDRVGHTTRPPAQGLPGCSPCPPRAAFFADTSDAAILRAVGAAEGLQARHVGKVFVLFGVVRADAEGAPELDVKDVEIAP